MAFKEVSNYIFLAANERFTEIDWLKRQLGTEKQLNEFKIKKNS